MPVQPRPSAVAEVDGCRGRRAPSPLPMERGRVNEQVRIESFRDLLYIIGACFRSRESLLREKAELLRQIEELKADPASGGSKYSPPQE